jgi:GT2 family glycosyltransferase
MAGDVAAIIVNYNMPERCDAICAHLLRYVKWPMFLIVVDNGSDLVEPSKYTSLQLPENVQTTGGWLAGLERAREYDPMAYWFLITSAEFSGECDPLAPLADLMLNNSQVVGVHPALTEESTSAWKHLFKRNGDLPRRVWMIDNIASLWRADWFDRVGGFDPGMKYGWGIDLELSYKAREQDRALYVHEEVTVKKTTDIGYAMERMNMSADERTRLAGANMDQTLEKKYGPDWNQKMRKEFVEEWML